MKLNRTLIPGAIVLALVASGPMVEAGQRDRNGRDRNGRESGGEVRQRGGGETRSRPESQAQAPSRGDSRQERGAVRPDNRPQDRPDNRPQVRPDNRPQDRGPSAGSDRRDANRGTYDNGNRGPNANRDYGRAVPRSNVDPRPYDRGRDAYSNRNYSYGNRNYRYDNRNGYDNRYRYYGSPRMYRPARPHYYGRGGNFSVYFGLGSGYLYGAPYRGRVYGYVAPRVYGARIYYGDVRLQVRPRDAQVYVDGYYAGIVDDFDGVFQRLTIEAGPHEIELSAPGLEPQVFDVYVDPSRTVDIRTDLYPY
jgi:hypothetical protein